MISEDMVLLSMGASVARSIALFVAFQRLIVGRVVAADNYLSARFGTFYSEYVIESMLNNSCLHLLVWL